MKKIKIFSLMVAILMLLATCVFAAEPQITIEGESTAKPGESKTATVTISSPDIEVGLVSGKIETNSNVKSIKLTGLNGWNLTYNQQDGVFNIYKAEGSKSEEILKIEYELTNEEGTAKILAKNVVLTTNDYIEHEIDPISKEIVVKAETEGNEPDGNEPDGNEPDGNEPEGNEPDGNEPDGNEPEGNEPDGNEPDGNEPDGNEPDGNEPDGNEPDGNEPEGNEPDGNEPDGNKPEEDNGLGDKEPQKPSKLPDTGAANYIIIGLALAVIAVVSYKKYKQYKNI